DQQANGQVTRRDKIDSIRKNDELRQVVSQAINRYEYVTGKSRSHRRGKILVVCFVELLTKVVETIEGHDDLEVAQAFLDLRTHATQGLQAFHVLALDPCRKHLRHDQHAESGHQRRNAQPEIEAKNEYSGARHHEQISRELHERLR